MAESSLFQTMFPNQPIDVMLLVENSHKMSLIWDDLRDRYLSCLMERLEVANDPLPASTTVWVLESQPLQTGSTALPRQYIDPQAALRDVRLNYLPENRISYNKVDEAVNFLSSLRASGEARALHLIVVAASSPAACIDVTGREVITDPSGFSPWYSLAHKLAQASIYCHILLRSTSEDMTALTALFDETLRSQSNIEDLVTFPPDSQFAVRLSMSPRKQGQFNPPPRPQRIPMPPRRNTFPLEPGYLPQYEDPYSPTRPVDMEGSPSIVSHLQQVHGLTKKKVYGAKPARQPFVRDEAPAYAAGPPLAGPAYSHDGTTLPPSSGRAMTHSKADRLARLAQASPTAADSQGRYLPVTWARRGSCISSPDEVDGVISPTSVVSFADISPPTSYMSSNMSSPISPASVDDYYGLPTAASSMPPPSAVNGGGPDPTWLQSPYAASYSQASMATVPAHYYISSAGPVPPTYHDGGMYMGHDYSMPPQLPPSGMPPKGLALPPMVIGSANKQPPPKSSSRDIPPPPGAEISAAPSSHHHHHASSERRTGSSTSKAATSNANGGSTSSASASSSSTSATGTLPPPPPVPATASSSSKTTAATTTSSSTTKRTRLPRPEDDEYIELDQDYVKETTDLFNAYFPNTENFPDSIVSTSSGTNTSLPSTSSPTSTSTSTISSSSTPPTTSSSATGAATGATITSSSTPSSSSSTGLTAVATPPGSGSSNSTSVTPPGTASPGGRNGSSTKSKSSKTGPGSPSAKFKGKKGATAGGGIQKRRGTASGGSGSKVGGNSSNGNGSSNNGRGLTGSPIPGPSISPSLRSPKISNPSSTSTTTNASSASAGSGSVGSITSGVGGMVASGPSSSDTNGIVPPPGSSFASAGIGTSVGVGIPAGGMLYGGSSGGVGNSQGIIPSASLPTREPLSGGMVGGGGGGLQIPPPLPLAAYSASAGAAANGYLQSHQLPPPLPLPTSLSAPPGSSYQPQYPPPMGGEYHRYQQQQQQQLHLPPGLPPSAIPHQLSNTTAASGTGTDSTTSMALQQHHMQLASMSASPGVGGGPPSYYPLAGYQYAHLAPAASGAPGPTSSLTGWAG